MSNLKPSEIILNKLIEEGPEVLIYTLQKKPCTCGYSNDKKYFLCDKLPSNVKFNFSIFDLIVSELEANGGRLPKGSGRHSKLGEGKCGFDTVAGVIGKVFFGKSAGESIYDPVFVLASVLEWAGICNNERGWLRLK